MKGRNTIAALAALACMAPGLSAYAGSNMLILSATNQGLLNFVAQQFGSGYVLWTGQAGEGGQTLIPVGGIVPQGYSYSGGGTVIVGDNDTSKNLALLLGNENHSTGDPSMASPQDKDLLHQTGIRDVAAGFNNSLNSYYGTALGQGNTIWGPYNMTLGYGNYAGWRSAIAIGDQNKAEDSFTYSAGTKNVASGAYALAIGNENSPLLVTAAYSAANKATSGVGSVSLGNKNGATGLDALAIGNRNLVLGDHDVGIGNLVNNGGRDAIAVGTGVIVGPAAGPSLTSSGAVAQPAANGGAASVDRAVAMGSWSGAQASDTVALGSYSQGATSSHVWGYSPVSGKAFTSINDVVSLMDQLTGELPPPPYNVQQLQNNMDGAKQVQDNLASAQEDLRKAIQAAQQNNLTVQQQAQADQAVASAKAKVADLQAKWQVAQAKNAPLSAWYSTLGAVSVGDGGHGITRQITGVAAGTENTDAVNVGQLKALALALKPVNYFNATEAVPTAALGVPVANNTLAQPGARSAGSIAVGPYALVTGTNGVALGMYSTVTSPDDGVAIGYGSRNLPENLASTVEAFTGDTWDPKEGTISFGNLPYNFTTGTGSTVPISGHVRRLRFVAGGIVGTDAVNLNQLTALAKMVGVTPADVAHYLKSSTGPSIYDQVKANSLAISKLRDAAPSQPPSQPSSATAGTGSWTLSVTKPDTTTATATVAAGDTVDMTTGPNAELSLQPGTHKADLHLSISETPTFKGITVKEDGGATISLSSKTGIDAGGLAIHNVGAGAISATSTDAINGSQLQAAEQVIKQRLDSESDAITTNSKAIGVNQGKINDNTKALGSLERTVTSQGLTIANQGTSIANNSANITALNRGVAGPVIYTNAAGQPVKVGSDGQYYLSTDLNSQGEDINGAKPVDMSSLRLSLVSPAGAPAIALGNVARATAGDEAVPLDQLKALLQDKGVGSETLPLVHYDSDDKTNITLGGVAPTTKANLVPQGVQIHNLAPGTSSHDAVNLGQLKAATAGMSTAINSLTERLSTVDTQVDRAGSMAAALAAMAPMPYVPGEQGQLMAGVGHYGTRNALALGYAHYKTANLLLRGGLAYGDSRRYMLNAGLTWRIGLSSEAAAKGSYEGGQAWKAAYADLATKYARLEKENQEMKASLKKLMAMMAAK